MHHWCKRSIDLYCYITPLETNGVAYFIAINVNANQSAIYQLHLHLFIASLECNLLLGFSLRTLLHLFDNKFHLVGIKWLIWLRTAVANSVRDTFYQFTCNPNNSTLGL